MLRRLGERGPGRCRRAPDSWGNIQFDAGAGYRHGPLIPRMLWEIMLSLETGIANMPAWAKIGLGLRPNAGKKSLKKWILASPQKLGKMAQK